MILIKVIDLNLIGNIKIEVNQNLINQILVKPQESQSF